MADDIQFGVVVTARQDSEAKNMMTASIEKLTGSISAKVGIRLVNSYKGQTIEQQLSNVLKKAENKSVKVSTRIVGTYKEHVKLIDGEYYDYKIYEIFADEYFSSIKTL